MLWKRIFASLNNPESSKAGFIDFKIIFVINYEYVRTRTVCSGQRVP